MLLVGSQEEDFFVIREILGRNRNALAVDLDHALSIEEAKSMLLLGDYGMVCSNMRPGTPPQQSFWPNSSKRVARPRSSC